MQVGLLETRDRYAHHPLQPSQRAASPLTAFDRTSSNLHLSGTILSTKQSCALEDGLQCFKRSSWDASWLVSLANSQYDSGYADSSRTRRLFHDSDGYHGRSRYGIVRHFLWRRRDSLNLQWSR